MVMTKIMVKMYITAAKKHDSKVHDRNTTYFIYGLSHFEHSYALSE